MQAYIFTFGLGHKFERLAVRITASNWQSARDCMINMFQLEFSTQYLETDYYETCKNLKLSPYPIIENLVSD